MTGMPTNRASPPAGFEGSESFGRLAIAWRAPLFRHALNIVGDEAAAHDAVQAALLAYWQHTTAAEAADVPSMDTPATGGSPNPYCVGIVVKFALRVRRDRARQARLAAAAAHAGRLQPPAPARDPADVAVAGEAWEFALRLPAPERDVLIDRYGLGLTQQETADDLGLALGTVKTRERRALRRLQKLYGVTPRDSQAPAVALPAGAIIAERLASIGTAPADFGVGLSSLTWLGSIGVAAKSAAASALGHKGLLLMATVSKSTGIATAAVIVALLGGLLLMFAPTAADDVPLNTPSRASADRAAGADAGPALKVESQALPQRQPTRAAEDSEPASDVEAAPARADVELADAETAEEAADEAPRRGQLIGRVVTPGGEPVGGATVVLVTLMRLSYDPLLRSDGGHIQAMSSVRATTDATGRFAIRALASGYRAAIVIPPPPYAEAASDVVTVQRHEVVNVGTIVVPIGGSVEGRVTDEQGIPVVGALVQLGGNDVRQSGTGVSPHSTVNTLLEDVGRDVRTDAAGRYRLDGLREGVAAVTAEAPGYMRHQREGVEVIAGTTTREVDFVLPPGGTMSVVVTDRHARPVADAEVVFTEGYGLHRDPAERPGALVARTNAAGEAAFAGMATLRGILTVSADGFGRYQAPYTGAFTGGAARVSVRLEALTAITGRLVDAHTGDGLTVSCRVAHESNPNRLTIMNFSDARPIALREDGSFVIEDVPEGLVRLMIRPQGYRWFDDTFMVREGGHSLGEIRLAPSFDVEVHVRDADGPADVRVDLSTLITIGANEMTSGHLSVRTDDDGVARFPDFGAERVRVTLWQDRRNITNRDFAVPADLAREEPWRIVLDLRVGGVVRGVYRNAEGEPHGDGFVMLGAEGGASPSYRHAMVGDDGRFEFRDVEPGRYRLRGQSGAVQEVGANLVDIDVAAGEVVTQDLQDAPPRTLRITVLRHDGSPYAHERIQLGGLYSRDSGAAFRSEFTHTTDGVGQVEPTMDRAAMARASFLRAEIGGREILIPMDLARLSALGEEMPTDFEVRLPDTTALGTLRIRVRERGTGRPIDGAAVRVFAVSSRYELHMVSVRDGSAEMADMLAGTYRVAMTDPRYIAVAPVQAVVVHGETTTVEIETAPAVSLRVLVYSESLAGVSMNQFLVMVSASREDGPGAMARGRFNHEIELAQLEPGVEYLLQVYEPNHETHTLRITPGPGAAAPIEVTLRAKE